MATNIVPHYTTGQYWLPGNQTAAPLPLGGILSATSPSNLAACEWARVWLRMGLVSGVVPANAINFRFTPLWNSGAAPGRAPHTYCGGAYLPAGTLGQTTVNASSASGQKIINVASSTNFTGQTTSPADTIMLCPPELAPVYAALDDGGAFTPYTTEIGNAGANDVVLYPDTPVVNDAFYWDGGAAPFTQMRNDFGTASSSVVMSTLLEYPTAQDVWTSLTSFIIADTSRGVLGDPTKTMQPAGTGSAFTAWQKPGNWASTTVNGQTGYFIRNRVTAYTSKTTFPIITQGWTQNLEPVTNTTALEFKRVAAPATGKLLVDHDLAYTHSGSGAGASVVTDNAQCFGPYLLQGGVLYGLTVDYAVQATGGPVVVEIMYEIMDYAVAG